MPDSNYTVPNLEHDTDHDLLFKAAYASWLLQQSGGGGGGGAPSGPAGGDLTGTYPDPTIGANKVTTEKILDNAVTYVKLPSESADTLLGRGNGGGAGDTQVISLGSGLSLSGTTLSASGGGFPGLPVWTFVTGGVPSSGEFAPNSDTIASTNSITFNDTGKYGDMDWGLVLQGNLSIGSFLVFVDSQGNPSVFRTLQAGADIGDSTQFAALTLVSGQSGEWVGDYQVSIWPMFQFGSVLTGSGITPVVDGTVTPVTSVTTSSGVVTSIS